MVFATTQQHDSLHQHTSASFFRHEIECENGNSSPRDVTQSLTSATTSTAMKRAVGDVSQDTMIARRYALVPDNHVHNEHDYTDIPDPTQLSFFKEAVIYYIAGYIIKTLSNIITCPNCLPALTDEKSHYYQGSAALLAPKDEVGMTNPSDSVVKVCMATETP